MEGRVSYPFSIKKEGKCAPIRGDEGGGEKKKKIILNKKMMEKMIGRKKNLEKKKRTDGSHLTEKGKGGERKGIQSLFPRGKNKEKNPFRMKENYLRERKSPEGFYEKKREKKQTCGPLNCVAEDNVLPHGRGRCRLGTSKGKRERKRDVQLPGAKSLRGGKKRLLKGGKKRGNDHPHG